MSVTEYNLKFEKFVFECGFQINHLPTKYMLYNGLRPDFKRELILHDMKSVKEMFLLTLELELSLPKSEGDVLRVRVWTLCL